MRRFWLGGLSLLVVAVAAPRLAAGDQEAAGMQTIAPAQSDRPLSNPGMGIYLNGTLDPEDMPPDAWFTKIIAIGYFRDDWADLEPDGDDGAKFDQYFGPISDLWVKRWGKRVAFRFMSSNMHSRRRCVTPEWVFARGVPSVRHRGLYLDEQVDPVFWDDTYLNLQEQFIARLGKYLDGRPGLEFIDIGGIGEWGEMHLSRWTAEELRATGFTEDRYIAAYRRVIDAFARAFPHTRVFLNVGEYEAINDCAALRGLHFRQDGLTPSGPSANVGKRFYRPYARHGVICNYEFHSGYDDMLAKGWGIRETFAKGLEDPISYLHINLTSYRQLADPPVALTEAISDAARRIGFRFVLSGLRCNKVVHLDGVNPGRLGLEQTWRNTGVAPCYDSYALRWQLADEQGHTVADALLFPRRPTTLWWPGDEIDERHLLRVPPDALPGSYRLKIAMVKPEEPALRIQLGLAGQDDKGSYDLGEVVLARASQHTEVVYQEGFEAGAGDWAPAQGMSVALDAEAKSGRASLLVTGAEPGAAWSYAWRQVTVRPYCLYRLSCWMKVAAIEPVDAPPYLKLGLDDADGTWITNFNTDPYDLNRLGSWQQLVTYCETPPGTASGVIAVEKGVLETPIAARIHLDDVKLELLEAP